MPCLRSNKLSTLPQAKAPETLNHSEMWPESEKGMHIHPRLDNPDTILTPITRNTLSADRREIGTSGLQNLNDQISESNPRPDSNVLSLQVYWDKTFVSHQRPLANHARIIQYQMSAWGYDQDSHRNWCPEYSHWLTVYKNMQLADPCMRWSVSPITIWNQSLTSLRTGQPLRSL
jgi:hypothetical protein